MPGVAQIFGQIVLYALFFVPLAYITHSPTHQYLPDDMAVLKIAIRHAGKIIGECTPLTGAEYDKLAANMKRPELCPRERSPLKLTLLLDGEALYRDTIPASGLHRDGVSSMYQRFVLPAGPHHLQLFMNDDASAEGNTWELDQNIELLPTQVMVAQFREGFVLQ